MSSHGAQLAEWTNAMTEFVMVYRQIPAARRDEPIDGGWSARQILKHLLETELIFSARMRVAIANPGGQLAPFDPDLYEARISYDKVPDDLQLDALAALRSVNLSVLRNLPGDAWQQTVQHPEAGTQTLEKIVTVFGNHVSDHLADIVTAGLAAKTL
ncbi:MAG: DinB family protein [Thermomicrobiales bacterium]|nr:DinB family protein [Thermomicrobiales bacterium]MCO5220457.1 DinB family protein [Thermomicrobiales bacterium]